MSTHKAAGVIIAGLALAIGACAPQEKSVVDNYFRAISAGDNQTLTSFAIVNFEEPVEAWKVRQLGTEMRSPVTLPDLVRKLKEAEAAVAANKKDYNNYFLEHPTEVDEVRELLKGEKPIPRKLETVAADWQGFVAKEKELKSTLAEAKDAVAREKKNVTLSVGPVEGVEGLEGEMVTKDLGLQLTIQGQPKDYLMTLRRYELQAKGPGPRMMSRWVVFDLKPQG